MADVDKALQVVDLVAGVQVGTAEEIMVPQESLQLKAAVQSSAMPFTLVEMPNSLKDT